MAVTKAKSNLFNKAKKAAPAKEAKPKDQKLRVKMEDEGFFDKISRLEMLQENLKRDKAEADMIADEIKDLGKVEWAKMYDKIGRNPESVMLEAKNGLDTSQVMISFADKYIIINEARAEYLTETFGEDAVTEKTTFSFDNEMVDKYGEILSELIENCDDITDDDKEKIVKAVNVFSVAKGSIDKLKEYARTSDMEISDIIDEIKPVVSLRNAEVIRG